LETHILAKLGVDDSLLDDRVSLLEALVDGIVDLDKAALEEIALCRELLLDRTLLDRQFLDLCEKELRIGSHSANWLGAAGIVEADRGLRRMRWWRRGGSGGRLARSCSAMIAHGTGELRLSASSSKADQRRECSNHGLLRINQRRKK
jgi:hypothetical protein